jgi:hypothetical protein
MADLDEHNPAHSADPNHHGSATTPSAHPTATVAEDARLVEALFRQSKAGRRVRHLDTYRQLTPLAAIVIVGMVAFLGPDHVVDDSALFSTNAWYEDVLLGVAVALFLSRPIVRYWIREIRREWDDRRVLDQYGRQLSDAVDELVAAEDDPSALIAYWKASQARLDSYHIEAEAQLRLAYRVAQVVSVLGFCLVVALGIAASVSSTTAKAAVTASVATVGAALAGYIGRTFQHTYERALIQRMAYFQQPVVAVQLLTAERLLSRLRSDETHDAAVLEIIRAATQVHANREQPSQGLSVEVQGPSDGRDSENS